MADELALQIFTYFLKYPKKRYIYIFNKMFYFIPLIPWNLIKGPSDAKQYTVKIEETFMISGFL